MKETSDFTYIVGLEHAKWEDAWSLCQSYAEGFYLADMNGATEAGLLKAWLDSLSIDEPYGKTPSYINELISNAYCICEVTSFDIGN